MFMGKPDAWYEASRWRCCNGHVSRMYLKTDFGPRSRCVSLNQARAKASANSAGFLWNRFEITMKGDVVKVVLNGKTVIPGASYPLVLQSLAGGKVYVGANDGRVRQLNLNSGAEEASRDVGGGSVTVSGPPRR